jgi:hypothetical protein
MDILRVYNKLLGKRRLNTFDSKLSDLEPIVH